MTHFANSRRYVPLQTLVYLMRGKYTIHNLLYTVCTHLHQSEQRRGRTSVVQRLHP